MAGETIIIAAGDTLSISLDELNKYFEYRWSLSH